MTALVVHHARKDLRLLGPVLLSWLALAVALHALVLLGVATYVPRTGEAATIRILFNVLLGLNVAGFIAVPVLVLQTDPAPGTTAFWLTRPVSLPWLLAAKCATLACLLVIVPVALDVLTMMAGGVGFGSAFAFVAESLVVQLAWLLPVVAVAAITSTLAHFVVAAAAEVAACALIMATINWLGVERLPSFASNNSYFAMLLGVLSILSLAVFVIGYGWRQSGGAVALACVAPVILCFSATRWPPAAPVQDRPDSVRHIVERSVTVPLVPGSRFRLAGREGELLSARATGKGYEVVLRRTGTHEQVRLYTAYRLRNPHGDTLSSGWRDFVDEPFFVTIVPVPQHLAVAGTTITFPWTERPDTDLERWAEGAVLVVSMLDSAR